MFISRLISSLLLASTIAGCSSIPSRQQTLSRGEEAIAEPSPIVLTSRYPTGRKMPLRGAGSVCLSRTSSSYDKHAADSIDALYRPGSGDESCAFPLEKTGAYNDAWLAYFNGLIETAEPDSTDGPRSVSLEVYFSPDGTVEHLYYGLVGIDEASFLRGAESYTAANRFPLKSAIPFKQCSSFALP